MTKFFLSLDLRKQIIILLGTTTILTIVMGAVFMFEHWQKYQTNHQVSALVDLSIEANSLVHSLQKERGLSVGYIHNRTKFGAKLSQQRREVDDKYSKVQKLIRKVNARILGNNFVNSIKDIEYTYRKLGFMRKSVDDISVSTDDIIKYYSSLNNKLINITDTVKKFSSSVKLSSDLTTYSNFLRYKDFAGIERAIGTIGFEKGFDENTLKAFDSAINMQKVYMSTSKASMGEKWLKQFNDILNSPSIKRVEEMREAALSGTGDNIDSQEWFVTATNTINKLKELEDVMEADIRSSIRAIDEQTFWNMSLVAALFFLVILPMVNLSRLFLKEQVACLDSIIRVLDNGAVGNLQDRIAPITAHGAAGESQRTANKFLNQVEMFIEEAVSAMNSISNEQFYRRIQTKGFSGRFLSAANAMQATIKSAAEKAERLNAASAQLKETVKDVVGGVSYMADDMSVASKEMQQASQRSLERSSNVEQAALTAQENSATVADAIEELTESIAEITSRTTESDKIIGKVQNEVESISGVVDNFGAEVQKIGEIAEIIQDIAEQINLLALNATIESARAGEAGKGFAVVASEVKNLAAQTAKATETITGRLNAIKTGSDGIISGVRSIGDVISQVSEISLSISEAIEEQNTVTQIISSNMQQVASDAGDVCNDIVEIKGTLENSAMSADKMREMTKELSHSIAEWIEPLQKLLNGESIKKDGSKKDDKSGGGSSTSKITKLNKTDGNISEAA